MHFIIVNGNMKFRAWLKISPSKNFTKKYYGFRKYNSNILYN